MKKKLIPAFELQIILLDEYYKAWQMRPGPNDYFPVQQIWDKIYKKFGSKIDGPLAEGVFNDLLRHTYVKALKTDEGDIAARLTSDGIDYLLSIKEKIRTRKIALLGAITGSLGLILSVVKIVVDLIVK